MVETGELEDVVQRILARNDGEVIARVARRGPKELLGGLQAELSRCGVLVDQSIMYELYFTSKWRHFVIALRTLREGQLPRL